MQAPNWTDFLQCSVCTNRYNKTTLLPISLSCGHTICKKCLTEFMARVCPYDKTAISPNAELLPPNSALMWLLGSSDGEEEAGPEEEEEEEEEDLSELRLPPEDLECFKSSRSSIRKSAMFLRPLSELGGGQVIHYLTRPMLKKLVTVVNCQFLEADGRARVLRAARSITDRTITELLVMHQNQQQISTLLWSAIRGRGCQFLGPVMQEEALKLILKVLEGGAFLSRKNIVLYVVQQLQQQDFHQASKTSVGHVVQLLYRASCFNVEKRDEDSSRMRLKEEFRTYEALRREHDAQIIRVAMEGGLRISPEQWSALLYGDQKHKSDMQSIIDKLLSMGIATSGLSELIVAIRRSQDQHNLLEKIVPHIEKLLKVDINIDKSSPLVQEWAFFSESMEALVSMLLEYSSFMRIQSGRYKTGLCPNLTKPGGCPKGEKCTYAHTEEERERYRCLARGAKNKSRDLGKPLSGPQSIPSRSGSGKWSGDLSKMDSSSSPYSSLGPSYEGLTAAFPSVPGAGQGYHHSGGGGGGGGGASTGYEGYSEYSTLSTAAPIVLQSVVGQQSNMTSDPNMPSQVISAQPQLVAYRSPHHSGPLTVSGEQLAAVYDPSLDPTTYYTTTQRRSGDYSVVGVAGDARRYSATDPYLAAGPPAVLESIKQVHANIKRNLQPSYTANEGGHLQYPPTSINQLHYLHNEGGQYESYSQGGVAQQLTTRPPLYGAEHLDQRHYHHDNNPGHAPTTAVVLTDPGVTGSYSSESRGEKGEGLGGGEGASEGQGDGLTNQMSQLQLKDPGYYETAPHSSGGGVATSGGGGATSVATTSSESNSSVNPVATGQSNGVEPDSEQAGSGGGTSGPSRPAGGSGSGPSGPSGGGGDMEAMREKIRELESQLASEKMRSSQQQLAQQVVVAGPQSVPGHAGLVYGNTTEGYSTQVQQYAPATPRVQSVQMSHTQPVQMFHPAVTVHQPSFYQSAPATPPYQYSNWSGPQSGLHYSGEQLSGLQSVPHAAASYLLQTSHPPPSAQPPPPSHHHHSQQQQSVRNVYIQQQQLAQDDKDHMLAMYLQTLEQSRVPQHQQQQQQQLPYSPHHTLPSTPHYVPQPQQQHSTQAGYAGGALLGYPTANHYVPSSGTQYMRQY